MFIKLKVFSHCKPQQLLSVKRKKGQLEQVEEHGQDLHSSKWLLKWNRHYFLINRKIVDNFSKLIINYS